MSREVPCVCNDGEVESDGAHLYPNPCTCRLVGLVMVFWLLDLLIYVYE